MSTKTPTIQEMDSLYDRYGKPLEKKHKGKFVAISAKGKVLIGKDELDVLVRGAKKFGHGNVIFKLGARSVGHIL